MGHTLAEKILAAKCDQKELFPGQFINARVDLVLASELSGVLAIEEFEKIRNARVFDPQKVVFVMDHFTPAKDIKSAEIVKQCREFADKHRIRFYDVGRAGRLDRRRGFAHMHAWIRRSVRHGHRFHRRGCSDGDRRDVDESA